MEWNEFSVMTLPPSDFVLVYVKFDGPDNPGAKPRVLRAYYSHHDGEWRTEYGRLKGTVTHWMLLPASPVERAESVAEFIKDGLAVNRISWTEYEQVAKEDTFMNCPHGQLELPLE